MPSLFRSPAPDVGAKPGTIGVEMPAAERGFAAPGRYFVASDWTPKKLHVEVAMPDTLSLEHLRARGPQPGEQLQPEEPAGGGAGGGGGGIGGAPVTAVTVEPDPVIVAQLMSMGFGENGSRRATVATQVCASAEGVRAPGDTLHTLRWKLQRARSASGALPSSVLHPACNITTKAVVQCGWIRGSSHAWHSTA